MDRLHFSSNFQLWTSNWFTSDKRHVIHLCQIFELDQFFITWCHIMQLPVLPCGLKGFQQSGHWAAAAAAASPPAAQLPTGHFSVGVRLHQSTWGYLLHPRTTHQPARCCMTSRSRTPTVEQGARRTRFVWSEELYAIDPLFTFAWRDI